MSVLVNFAMFPTDQGTSKSESVSKVLEFIKNSGVDYKLSPMATTVETETMEEALAIINGAYKVLESDHERIYSTITIDARKGDLGRMTSKIDSIENKIGTVNK
ncbi:thiamine-binding protein [Plebeiibacterium sediminum]|uniref:Thiamine-binding protein n=1 Tax=Plebeiibacterium sediminum TaxID=2992112 RepID=A0AAE3M3A5_9BACT|nr:thiamine-binding protein [Plebeiobacterium sediminum]MCW3786344.1 thiamine-binding protein [Plebeiobacterium sediminum]